MTDRARQCDYWTRPRQRWPGGPWVDSHRCRRTAYWRVQARPKRAGDPPGVVTEGEYACGQHVRPALMDNGDSVWQPWLVTYQGDGWPEGPSTNAEN